MTDGLKNRLKAKVLNTEAGDTIVEVMLAIAVAAFTIGTSYAIANHSLQTAINARDRNQALNLIESQIAALKFRQKTDPTNFAQFEVPAAFVGTGIASHFCLDTAWLGPNDTNPAHQEGPQNNGINEATATDLQANDSKYSPTCKPNLSGTTYYVDIAAMVTTATNAATFKGPKTVYKVEVRWPPVGNSQTQQATVYYRF